jgi:hypothetical protein
MNPIRSKIEIERIFSMATLGHHKFEMLLTWDNFFGQVGFYYEELAKWS